MIEAEKELDSCALCKKGFLQSEIDRWTSPEGIQEITELSKPTNNTDARFGYDDEDYNIWDTNEFGGFAARHKLGGTIFYHDQVGKLIKVLDESEDIIINQYSEYGQLIGQRIIFDTNEGRIACARRIECKDGKPDAVVVQFSQVNRDSYVERRLGSSQRIDIFKAEETK